MMKTSIEDISSVKKRLMIEIEAEEVDKKVDAAYKRYGKTAKIKGFRPGKVPKKILERYFGDQVLEDVTNSLIKETLPEALEETKVYPLNMPAVENEILKIGQNYKYSALFEVRPEFDLKNYLGVKIEKEKYVTKGEDVDRQLEEIREARGNLTPLEEDRGIKDGDVAIIDYEGFDKGEPVGDVKAENYSLTIGKKQFFPGVEEALIGLKKGDKTEITVDFEENYFHSKLAGKSILIKVNVMDIKRIELPELNDEFAKDLGIEVEGLDQLKEKIREELASGEEKRIEEELKDRLVGKISESVDFDLPESLVDAEINASLENVKQNLMRAGSSFEKSGMDEVKLREEIRPAAEKRIKGMLILGEIARKENLKVDEKDVEDSLKDMSEGMGADSETLRKYYEANNLMDSLRQSLLKEKTLKYLVENAKVSEVAAEKIKDKQKDN
jgi:trigger factor